MYYNRKYHFSLRNLEVTLDSTLLLYQHVLNICRRAFLELRRINSIRNFLSTDAVKTLICHLFGHVLTIAILYSQVYLSVSLRRNNMCKMLQQSFFGHQNLIRSCTFFKSITGYPLTAEQSTNFLHWTALLFKSGSYHLE